MRSICKWIVVCLVLAMVASFTACTKNYTPIGREESARPRVEQIAFSAALESAYKKVDMSFVRDKRVFVETKALSRQDVEYINSYVRKRVIAAGGTVVMEEPGAEIKLTNFLEVTGTDEVQRSFGKDLVVAQVRGNLTITDLKAMTVTKILDLKGMAQTKRNKKADTRIIE